MTMMRSPDGAETFTTPLLNEDLDDEALLSIEELRVWRRQTPESTLDTSPADITTYAPPPPLDPPGVYHPPALVPDGVDDLTDQEYLSPFKPPRPLENRKPGPTNPPARTPSTND